MPGRLRHHPLSAPDAAGCARLAAENAELRMRLGEAEDALRAIREGEVDAVIVSGSHGDRVFSLMETENLHRLMVETMNEAGLAIAPEGLLLYANERAAALLGQPRDTLLGQPLETFVAPPDRARLQRLLEASRRGTADDRIAFRTAAGTLVPMHLWASRLSRPEDPMICLVGTDLSRLEANQALVARLEEQQQALRASHDMALELMSQAVTAREQAAQAAHELRESDRRKDTFLATLAHELRNPLAPIRSAMEILRRPDLAAPEARQAQAVMERQFAHLVRLVDDLLEVSRITRGKIDLRRERVELAAILGSAVETVRPLLDAARQQLRVRLPDHPVWLNADPVRLTQVFGNLLNNANKFTPDGGAIAVEVQTRAGEVRVSVHDTGIGIPAELLPRVFDPFQQGDPDQLPVQGGLGIGLSLVRNLVQLHDGQVQAFSAGQGQGSELRVILPLARSRAAAPSAGAPVPARAVAPSVSRRILVVDDNRDAADSLALLLRLRGHVVQVAYEGRTALARLDGDAPPEIAILDIGMPGMDGCEVARHVRMRPRCRQVMLIAVTGRGQESDRQRALGAGFDRYLVKPVAHEVLERLLAETADAAPDGDPAPGAVLAPDGAEPEATAARSPRDLVRALLHELAQPLGSIGCYAAAARTLAAKAGGDTARLCHALHGIEQQIRQASVIMERLRALFDQHAREGAAMTPTRRTYQ